MSIETIENTEPADVVEETPEAVEEATEPTTEDAETFPREYVQKLRDESAKYRTRAQQTDALAHRLHEALTAATGRLADPTDLPFDEAHLDDPDALNAAVDALLVSKPHLASRTPRGDVGQGASDSGANVSLAGLLRAGAY